MASVSHLELLLPLLRTLSHQVRTPLSVISNDLNYFKNIINSDECDRAIKKCSEISDFFMPANSISLEGSKEQEFDLNDLVTDLTISRDDLAIQYFGIKLLGIRENLFRALEWTIEILRVSKIVLVEDGLLMILERPLEIKVLIKSASSSLKEICEECRCNKGILPFLVDAVFESFAAKLLIQDQYSLLLTFDRRSCSEQNSLN